MPRLLFAVLVLCLPVSAAFARADTGPLVQPAPEWDALFQRESGWIGADGDFSVALSSNTTLWLFSDTFVGEVKDGHRTNAVMIHNSVALQHGKERPEFYYGKKTHGAADSFIAPADGRGYFWLFAGVRAPDALYFFPEQVEATGETGAFGFRHTGTWLASVSNPEDAPDKWKIAQRKIPFGEFSASATVMFGSATLQEGGFIYIYGFDDHHLPGRPKRAMIVARVPEDKLADFDQWRFQAAGHWSEDWREATPLCAPAATEYSVSWLPALNKYVMIHSDGISGKVMLRLAPAPTGPWTEPLLIFQCLEQAWPGKVFCYAAKAHPELPSAPDELLITYAANSFDFSHTLDDARLYWPRFVRLDLQSLSTNK